MASRKAISLTDAALRTVTKGESSLVREFDLHLVVERLFREKQLDGIPLRVRKERSEPSDLAKVIAGLLEQGTLTRPGDVPYTGLFERPGEPLPAERVVCFMDPLCYLAYLSAMQWHGLTDRRPKPIQAASPRGTHWTTRIDEMMRNALARQQGTDEATKGDDVPVRGRFAWRSFPAPVRGHEVERHQESYWRPENYIDAAGVRVSTIGRTYLDMIRHPSRCGGIHHVLEVFEEHGRRHRNLIVREVNESGTKLDKSRVGYILEERLGVKGSPTLESWLHTAVQRGGSRKLDAEAQYSPNFSERWCLSLNV